MKQALKCGCAVGALIMATVAASAADDDAKKFPTATPIKHLVDLATGARPENFDLPPNR